MGRAARRGAVFVLIGAALYLLVYGLAESLGAPHGARNRFRVVRAAAPHYDFVLLGASHMLPLGFEDMSDRLGAMVGGTVINLAVPGGGIVPNRLMLQYFLQGHSAGMVVYGVDSFAFYAPEWNEARLHDVRLWRRAPHDAALVRVLWGAARDFNLDRSVFWNYLTGFAKVNNPLAWFEPDPWADDARFDQVFRGPAYRYQQRIRYLYPGDPDETHFRRYLKLFLAMIDDLHARGIAVLVFKPPLPSAFSGLIPHEERFNEVLATALQERGVPMYDFTDAMPSPEWYFDTDHLNRAGVLHFFENHLRPVLVQHHLLR